MLSLYKRFKQRKWLTLLGFLKDQRPRHKNLSQDCLETRHCLEMKITDRRVHKM